MPESKLNFPFLDLNRMDLGHGLNSELVLGFVNKHYFLSPYIFPIDRMMEEPQPLAPAMSSLKTAAPATPSKSVNFKISPVSP